MKNIFSTLILCFVLTIGFAQVPQAMKYQSIVRNTVGNPMANTNMNIRATVHESSATGVIVYQETHAVTTNQFGLINLEIGNGTAVSGIFSAITWGTGSKWMEIEADFGSGYVPMGASQLLSVPYALYSGNGAGPAGPTGAAGANGANGANGLNGTNGLDGTTGAAGTNGANGLDGATGAAGTNGINGVTGAVGANGNDGATGAAGTNGANGLDGATGAAGTNGINGATGAVGANGNDGATGPAGTNGFDGATGPSGTTGATGANGFDGATGPSGSNGAAGATGTNGATGATGANGFDGATGPSGSNGATGATGANGFDGATGPAGETGTSAIIGFGYVYNVLPQTVAIEAPIVFDSNGPLLDVIHAPGTPSITISNSGTYSISFSISATESNQFAIFVNGVPENSTLIGAGSNLQQNSGQFILALGAGDVITIVNHSSATAVSLATVVGGTQSNVNAFVHILRVL